MKEKIEEISLSMERGHRRILRVLGALLAVGLFVLLWKWRGPAALEPLIDGGMRRWTRAVLGSIVIALAAQWVLYLLPWPLLALLGRRRPFCSVFSLRPCVGSKAELSPRPPCLPCGCSRRARRRGAVVHARARAARVVLARGDGKRRLHRRGAWHGV